MEWWRHLLLHVGGVRWQLVRVDGSCVVPATHPAVDCLVQPGGSAEDDQSQLDFGTGCGLPLLRTMISHLPLVQSPLTLASLSDSGSLAGVPGRVQILHTTPPPGSLIQLLPPAWASFPSLHQLDTVLCRILFQLHRLPAIPGGRCHTPLHPACPTFSEASCQAVPRAPP